MEILFSEEFSEGNLKELFTVFRVNNNLYQAKSDMQVIVLWQVDSRWEGVCSTSDASLIQTIGSSIDKFYSTGIQFT